MNASVSTVIPARPKLLRKITPKTITEEMGINLLALNRPVQPQELYKLYCRITGTKMTTTTLGESMGFLGDFRAVTPDGRRFISGKTYIPVVDSMLFSALQDARDPDSGGDPKAVLQTAVSIAIKPAPTNKPSMTGYEFDVQILTQPSEDDPLSRLERDTAEQLKLPGPSAGTSTEGAGASNGATASATAPAADAPATPAKGHKGAAHQGHVKG
jgi:hypothetical protein